MQENVEQCDTALANLDNGLRACAGRLRGDVGRMSGTYDGLEDQTELLNELSNVIAAATHVALGEQALALSGNKFVADWRYPNMRGNRGDVMVSTDVQIIPGSRLSSGATPTDTGNPKWPVMAGHQV